MLAAPAHGKLWKGKNEFGANLDHRVKLCLKKASKPANKNHN